MTKTQLLVKSPIKERMEVLIPPAAPLWTDRRKCFRKSLETCQVFVRCLRSLLSENVIK